MIISKHCTAVLSTVGVTGGSIWSVRISSSAIDVQRNLHVFSGCHEEERHRLGRE